MIYKRGFDPARCNRLISLPQHELNGAGYPSVILFVPQTDYDRLDISLILWQLKTFAENELPRVAVRLLRRHRATGWLEELASKR